MSTYNIDWMPGEDFIFGKIYPEFKVLQDTPPSSKRLLELLLASDHPVPYLLDLTEIRMNFGEMVQAMGLLTRGDLASFVHPNLSQLIVVSTDNMIKIGAAALGQSQYGGRRAIVVPSMQDGLAVIRAKAKA